MKIGIINTNHHFYCQNHFSCSFYYEIPIMVGDGMINLGLHKMNLVMAGLHFGIWVTGDPCESSNLHCRLGAATLVAEFFSSQSIDIQHLRQKPL